MTSKLTKGCLVTLVGATLVLPVVATAVSLYGETWVRTERLDSARNIGAERTPKTEAEKPKSRKPMPAPFAGALVQRPAPVATPRQQIKVAMLLLALKSSHDLDRGTVILGLSAPTAPRPQPPEPRY